MLLSQVRYPVHTLGFGVRAGVWTQGCRLACEGCIAPHTWPADPNAEVPVAEVVGWLASLPEFHGVTISGGEPLDQPGELLELLRGVRRLGRSDCDVLLYSGRTWEAVRRAFPEVLEFVDTVVTGPFEAYRPSGHPLRGSANQEVVTLTPLGRRRHADLSDDEPRPLQVSVSPDGRLHTVGIPRGDDLARLADAVAARGLKLVDPTWGTP